MKKAILIALTLCFVTSTAEARMTKGYIKNNGTYVAPSFKTSPNRTKIDNYSTKGNSNPYSGKKGYVNPYPSYAPSAR